MILCCVEAVAFRAKRGSALTVGGHQQVYQLCQPKTAQYRLAPAGIPMWRLAAIDQSLARSVIEAWAKLGGCNALTAKLISQDDPMDAPPLLECSQEALSGLLILVRLLQDFECVSVGIDCTTEQVLFPASWNHNFVEVPLVSGLRTKRG